jgi:NAD(P)-dependent dehydrogenase (short-subunit alcohol dehydrogenase family)
MSTPERTIVITGASSGFGAAAVRAFTDRGDRVWGTMRDTAGRNAAKKAELEAYSPRIAIAEMDVTSDASVADGFAAILANGPIDILINNAGIMYIGMTEAYSVAQAAEQMDTNYFGAIRAMQAVLPSMRAAGSGLPSSAPIARRNMRWKPTVKASATRFPLSASTSHWSNPARSPRTCWPPASRPPARMCWRPMAICATCPRPWSRVSPTC